MAALSDIIKRYDLSPLPGEGGYFRFIDTFGENSGCIYYLITPDTFSSLHKLTDDEMWFFLEGGEAEQLIIHPDGREEVRTLSSVSRSSLVKSGCF
ncbi:MAG: cupin domain-containing protein, partial [Bullifex sp.]